MYRALTLLILIFLLGCQNRNQVTHNKRKYNKGYYKPNRAKVKHRKSSQQEEYTYNSERTKQNATTKTPQKTGENKSHSLNKEEKENGSTEDKIVVEDEIERKDKEQRSPPVKKEKEEKKIDETNQKVEISKVAFWLTFSATLLQILISFLLLFLINTVAFGLAALIGGLIVVGLAIWLIIQARRDSAYLRMRVGFVFLIIGIIFSLLGFVFLIFSNVTI